MTFIVIAIATLFILRGLRALNRWRLINAAEFQRQCEETRKSLRERFPPISDEEFMTRCRPGTRPEIALKVRRIIADCLAREYDCIYPGSRLVADLDAE